MFKLAIVCLVAFAPQDKPDTRLETAVQQAKKSSEAAIKSDAATLVDLMPNKLIEESGGREKMVENVTKSFEIMKQQGMTIASAKVGQPDKLHKGGSVLYCLIPQSVVINIGKSAAAGEGTLSSDSYLLAMSDDEGKNWKFIDISPGEQAIRGMFPELPDTLKFPKLNAPKFTPKEKTEGKSKDAEKVEEKK
jgi:hypothetical protein